MKLKIITPSRLVLNQEVESVTLPGVEGEMTLLPLHAAMVALLKKGEMRYLSGGKEEHFLIGEGAVEVLKDHVVIMTKSCETPAAGPTLH